MKDQEYTKGNLALLQSTDNDTPVRVIRGAAKTSGLKLPYAPSKGYRYDGSYLVQIETTESKNEKTCLNI